MNTSIITIGDELLIGQTIDTNSAFIAKAFNEVGLWVRRRVAVGDVYSDIQQALDQEGEYADVVIITGGLGPTADDITKPCLCDYFGGKLIVDNQVLANIQYIFENIYHRKGPLLERNAKQAEVPDVCTVLPNRRGTAPGMWFEKNNSKGKNIIFISLPGVPHEMKGLIEEEVIPRLLKRLKPPAIIHRTAVTAGMGESLVAERLSEFEKQLPKNIQLAYLPNFGMLKLRLTSKGSESNNLSKELDVHFGYLTNLVKDILIAVIDDPIEIIVGKLLLEQQKTMATAESCTGGNIAHWITKIPGSSAYFKGGIVSYANEAKENLLHVEADTLKKWGAVSEQTVQQMVRGTVEQFDADFGVATSGIAGPDGGSREKPVGTIWIAAGNAQRIITKKLNLRFDRQQNIKVATAQALLLLREFIIQQ